MYLKRPEAPQGQFSGLLRLVSALSSGLAHTPACVQGPREAAATFRVQVSSWSHPCGCQGWPEGMRATKPLDPDSRIWMRGMGVRPCHSGMYLVGKCSYLCTCRHLSKKSGVWSSGIIQVKDIKVLCRHLGPAGATYRKWRDYGRA